MSQQPKKRLGRGLDSLINAGLTNPAKQSTPPAVQIVATRVERVENKPNLNNTPRAQGNPAAAKKDLIDDLNSLLKKTQDEAKAELAEDSYLSASDNNEAMKAQDGLNAEDAAELSASDNKNSSQPSASASANEPASGQGVFMLLPLKAIALSPYQRRKEFAAEALKDLEASIRSEGLMQPIVVRVAQGGYELIAGERRLRACTNIGMEVIPARVVSVANASAAVMGLIENLQRENLNPVEEARGYGMLLTDFHMTQEQISERVGKARATVANSLRLLMLESEILGYVSKGQLTMGHAKVLLGLPEGSARVLLARTIVEQGLSVRQAEALMRRNPTAADDKQASKRLASEAELAVVNDLQKRLMARLNAKVSLNHAAKGGRITVYYKSNAELEGILKKIGL